VLGSDGSGGRFGAAVLSVSHGQARLRSLSCGTLSGLQTVPRSEIVGAKDALALRDQEVAHVIDATYVTRQYHLKGPWRSSHADDWNEFFGLRDHLAGVGIIARAAKINISPRP